MVLPQFECFMAEDKTSQQSDSNSTSSFLFGLVDFLTCQTCFHKILMFFSTLKFFFLCQIHPSNNSEVREELEEEEEQVSESDQESEYYSSYSSEEHIERDEVKMVMENLGLFYSSESEELNENYGSNEISELFEDQEPSVEELKKAFDVFDENRDGFIDAKELQSVLSVLGFKEAAEIEDCQIMIKKFDENQDGRIDLIEFEKIMQNSFC
ncbi:probable calcium-binding protein CML45 [Lotus japonicus]|uniref:probable calcium-binding protein CML45 n=1 Tax=Lotus japonicus TaxID=34305 RepID=UPI00258C561B|nr:probable calcium-binding protein CML45 [Lotus japonicus]